MSADLVRLHLTKRGINERRRALLDRQQALLARVRTLDDLVVQAEAKAARHVLCATLAVFGTLVAQTCVLFYWVFDKFDWNLVEPMTYFLGYTPVWLGVVYYFKTGNEFTYDNLRDSLFQRVASKEFARLQRAKQHQPSVAIATLGEVAAWKAEAASIVEELARIEVAA